MQDYMPRWPLKVLILSSDPRNADRLRLAQEHRDLQVAIRGTYFASSLDILNEPSCRYSDITAVLDRINPHVLHFSGHGGEDVLYFEDVQGTAKAVKKQALAGVLSHQKELQLVILNACFSLDQGQAFADAVGLAIVSEGSILDQDAIDFSREFYTALGYGQRSYIEAFGRAKSALEMTGEMKLHLLQRETPSVQDFRHFHPLHQVEGNSLGAFPQISFFGREQRSVLADALSYLDQRNVQFQVQPSVYNRCLSIMEDYKSQAIDTPAFIERILRLFVGYPEIIQGFKKALPNKHIMGIGRGEQDVEALYEDAYFDTLEREEKEERVIEALQEDAYFDTLEREEKEERGCII